MLPIDLCECKPPREASPGGKASDCDLITERGGIGDESATVAEESKLPPGTGPDELGQSLLERYRCSILKGFFLSKRATEHSRAYAGPQETVLLYAKL